MCGIVGIVSNKSVSANIIGALKKLEYRGYDSAGIATINKGQINEQKCSGRVDNLEKILFRYGVLKIYSKGKQFDKYHNQTSSFQTYHSHFLGWNFSVQW